jgi:hypothetical protein
MAMATGNEPTGIGASASPVAVSIGVTEPPSQLST